MDQYDYLLKLVIIGDSRAGKSTIIERHFANIFEEFHLMSVGAEIKLKKFLVDGKSGKMQVWDTSGIERYRTITISTIRGSKGVIIVFDKSNRDSFFGIDLWINIAKNNASSASRIFLVGNKSDLPNEISSEEAIDKALFYGIHYLEVSARTNQNIELLFELILRDLLYN